MRVGLAYDLRQDYLNAGYGELETAEFDRPDTIDGIASALTELGHQPIRIGHIRQLAERLVNGERWDLVFNIAEGLSGYGREAQVPALLEAYGIPYTFSDPLVSALTLHKGMAKRIVRDCGLATPEFHVVESERDIADVQLSYPLFAKPVAEGTGKGVTPASKITSRQELDQVCRDLLARFQQPVLVERYLAGREFTVGILGTGVDAGSIGTVEIRLREAAESEVYSYTNKELCEELVEYARVERGSLLDTVEALAVNCWRALGCRDGGRVDIRLDQAGNAHFLEVNPLAGLHPEHSDLPIIASHVGLPYRDLIAAIIDSAAKRISHRVSRCEAARQPRATAA
jgi:D-alanine-D-alanine ligase